MSTEPLFSAEDIAKADSLGKELCDVILRHKVTERQMLLVDLRIIAGMVDTAPEETRPALRAGTLGEFIDMLSKA